MATEPHTSAGRLHEAADRVAAAAASTRRTASLLTLPVGAVGAAAEGLLRRTVLRQDRADVSALLRRRGADRTRRVLGRARGGALKAGQLVSTLTALLPADPENIWADTLASFGDSATPVPFAALEPSLRAALGEDWRQRLELDETPAAAASLGQVHRGRWREGVHAGDEVAVKIQYPGVAAALRNDLRMVSAATRVAAVIAPGAAVAPLVRELRLRLGEELDYAREARVQRTFAEFYRGDPDVVVPEVVTAAGQVLVSTWLSGTSLTRLATTGSQPQRDRAGTLYQRFLLSGPERCGWLHTDPHPGNFRLLADGRLGVLDFGSALELPGGLPVTFGRLIRALQQGSPAAVRAALEAEDMVEPGADLDVEALMDYLGPFTDPAGKETFTFSPEWLRAQMGRVNDPRHPDFAVALSLRLPAEHLFTHRVWLGIVGVLCGLGATVPNRSEIERWLPGFADPPAA